MTQPALIQRTIPLHPALPEAMRSRLAGRQVSRPISRSVRARLRQPEDISVSECAARYRRVTPVDAKPGPWRNDLVPHAVEAMDLFQEPSVKEIWLCWPERTAKTNVMLNCVAAVTRGVRNLTPGNIFWLEPAEDDTNIKTKIIPMFRESPKLKKYLSKRADDTGKKLIAFAHGTHLFPASANSARTMANYFGKYCFCNEPDKYPNMVGTETDPIKLIRKRGRDVRNSKFMFGSTPAGKFIYKGTMSCQQVKKLHNRCPHCSELILMDDEHLVFNAVETLDTPQHLNISTSQQTLPSPDQVENGTVAVGYACNACGTVWDEYDRERSYHDGRFVIVKGADIKKPVTVGLHASALPFPMIPLAEYAGKYLRSKTGDHADKVDYSHGYQVIDYKEEVAEAPELASLADRVEDYAPVVPMEAGLLTSGVDVQMDRLEVEVVAWGVGGESWGIEYEVLYGDTRLPDVWGQLDGFLLRERTHATGEPMSIARTFVDGGYIPNTVARFCFGKKKRGIYMIKGASAHKAPEVQGPVSQRHGGYRVEVFNIGGNRVKTQMFGWFGLLQPGPGYCHIPSTYPPQWFTMLQAEHAVERKIGSETVMVWEKKPGQQRNESVDLRQYALAAYMSLRADIKSLVAGYKARAADKAPAPAHRRTDNDHSPGDRSRPSWFNSRR